MPFLRKNEKSDRDNLGCSNTLLTGYAISTLPSQNPHIYWVSGAIFSRIFLNCQKSRKHGRFLSKTQFRHISSFILRYISYAFKSVKLIVFYKNMQAMPLTQILIFLNIISSKRLTQFVPYAVFLNPSISLIQKDMFLNEKVQILFHSIR